MDGKGVSGVSSPGIPSPKRSSLRRAMLWRKEPRQVAQAATIAVPDRGAVAVGGDKGSSRESGRSPEEENQPMMKAITVGVLGTMMWFFTPSPAASQEEPGAPEAEVTVPLENALSGDEVRKLFAGNTELGEGMKGEEATGLSWIAYFAADGTARRSKVDGTGKVIGTWFVDSEGRNCFQWEGWEEPKCDLIVPEGDQYLRVREGWVRARIKIQQGNPNNL